MRRAILSLFKRIQPAKAAAEPASAKPELSRTVIAAIDNAHILVRSLDDDDGYPRVAIQMGNGAAFHWNDESVERFLSKLFPELGPAERILASRRLAILVQAELRQKVLSAPDRPKPWRDRY